MPSLLVDLLVKWVKERRIQKNEDFKNRIWEELEELFKDMMQSIEDNTQAENDFCAFEDEDEKQILGGDNKSKELCKILLRMFFWMGGLELKYERNSGVGWQWVKKKWKKGESEEEKELQAYLRCLVGRVTMTRMLGTHCKLDKVAGLVKEAVDGYVGTFGGGDHYEVCKEIDINSVGMGQKFIWGEAQKWINEYSTEENPYKGIKKVSAGNSALHKIKGEGQDCPGEEGQRSTNRKALEELGIKTTSDDDDLILGDDDVSLDNTALEDVLKGVKDNKIKNHNDLQNEVKEKVKQKKAITAADVKCKEGTICDRADCVTKEWKRIRSNRESQKDESEVWYDFPTRVDAFVTAMSTPSKNEDQYCNDTNWKNEDAGQAKKKACHLIVKGLKHIYNIQLTSGTDEHNPVQNQEFKQFVACLLLNEFAKQMKEKCPGKKEDIEKGIEKGFGFMEKIKGDKCSITYPCVECKWEKEVYETCKMGGQQVRSKLKELFQSSRKKDEIEKTLNDISTLCKTPPTAPPGSPARSDKSGAEDDVPPLTPPPPPDAEESEDGERDSPSSNGESEPPQLPAPLKPRTPEEKPSSEDGTGSKQEDTGKNITPSTETSKVVDCDSVQVDGDEDTALKRSLPAQIPSAAKLTAKKGIDPFLPYLPLAPAVFVISVMSYLLWKYFGMLRKTRKRYRRAAQIRGPSLEQQIVDHVEQQDGPREYTLKMFLWNRFQVQIPDLGRKDFVPKEDVFKEQVPSSDSAFREEDFVSKEDVPRAEVPKEQVPSLRFSV
ncbi:Uncharacterized protein PCOAH_00019290 [Plasmodium coatneyi]|uniref:SICA antigen n=1 Tax=Plasmodium coatneyi TaxID=208452 RepID=A0A1B1DXC7_9APIC|nr:Uncharacterized protein PCOAH_00019290 [Plasmodium coatneyi]ANQ07257.1 Uncharacterized protein PCOAH_00019290 [Plasmodium coatneyi]